MTRLLFLASLLVLIGQHLVGAQSSPLQFEQKNNDAPPQPLSAAERGNLGDPLFNLLLKDKANVLNLSQVMATIQPNAGNHHLFVVSERIVQSTPTHSRRAVVAFDGGNNGETLQGNAMLSVIFGPNGLQDDGEIEAWGWDQQRGRYNYYRLDAAGSAMGTKTWKFRGSSDGADLLRPAERTGTCLQCHVVGAPVMKELLFPWNNWHAGVGGSFEADYLDPNSAHPNKWPAANTLPFQRLGTADTLEKNFLIPAFKQFNQARLKSALKRDAATGDPLISPAGRMTVQEGQRLLRPLFEAREVNLISSSKTSGLDPFGQATDFVPTLQIPIPVSFFLNAHLIAGGNLAGLGGLKLTEANQFSSFAKLTQQENKDLIERLNLRLNGSPKDTRFGWFVPEPAFVDNNLVDQALQRGVVTPHFVAAVLAIDVETAVFSAERARLLTFVPDQFEFTPVPEGVDPVSVTRDATQDLLTRAVIANIDQANPGPGTPAAEFRMLLNTANAVSELQARMQIYMNRLKSALGSPNTGERQGELERLYHLLIKRRGQMGEHLVLRSLDETEGRLLFPLPSQR